MQELKEALKLTRADTEEEVAIDPSVVIEKVSEEVSSASRSMSREELKRSLALYRQELQASQEAVAFIHKEKPVANINAHNSATSKTGKKLSAKQIKSRQVTNMKKVGLLAGLFKQAS